MLTCSLLAIIFDRGKSELDKEIAPDNDWGLVKDTTSATENIPQFIL